MKLLMRYQMRFLRFNFIFTAVAFAVVALLFRGDLLTSPDRLAMYAVILSIMYNYYSFLTTQEFRRNLLTLPIPAKDIVKTVFLTFIIMTTYIFIFATMVGLITILFSEVAFAPFIGILFALPIVWVVMGVKHFALLKTDIEGDFAIEMLVYFGVGLLFGVPIGTIIFNLPNEFFGFAIGILYILCSAITYYTYKLCCKNADRIYVIVKYKGSKDVHESIHSKQLVK